MENKNRNKLTLRIPKDVDEKTKELSDSIGISQNAFLLMLIDLGLRNYGICQGYVSSSASSFS